MVPVHSSHCGTWSMRATEILDRPRMTDCGTLTAMRSRPLPSVVTLPMSSPTSVRPFCWNSTLSCEPSVADGLLAKLTPASTSTGCTWPLTLRNSKPRDRITGDSGTAAAGWLTTALKVVSAPGLRLTPTGVMMGRPCAGMATMWSWLTLKLTAMVGA